MGLEGAVAVIGILLAAHAILPPARRLDIQFRLGWLDVATGAAAFVAVSYLHFLPYLAEKEHGLDAGHISNVILCGWLAFIVMRVRTGKLTPRNMRKFHRFAHELLWSEQYHELSLLLEQHHKGLFRINRADYLLPRLRRHWLSREGSSVSRIFEHMPHEELQKWAQRTGKLTKPEKRKLRWASCRDKLKRLIARMLPPHERAQRQAGDLVRQTFTSPAFVGFLAKSKPCLGISVMRQEFDENPRFLELYLQAMLADPGSLLCCELRNNQNLTTKGGYVIPEENRLLHAMFGDARVAEKRGVWGPIGEAMMSELDRLHLNPAVDSYNLPMDDFRDKQQWDSQLWLGVRFFDIMVSAALHQGVQWHMWLYYFPLFAQKICRNYKLSERSAQCPSEWPSRYSYILYSMFSAMTDWIGALEHLPLDQPNVKLASVSIYHENGNIPKSAVIAIAGCLSVVLAEEKIPDEFKRSLASMVFRLYLGLRLQRDRLGGYATVLLLNIAKPTWYERGSRDEYWNHLTGGFRAIDKLHYDTTFLGELEQFLRDRA